MQAHSAPWIWMHRLMKRIRVCTESINRAGVPDLQIVSGHQKPTLTTLTTLSAPDLLVLWLVLLLISPQHCGHSDVPSSPCTEEEAGHNAATDQVGPSHT